MPSANFIANVAVSVPMSSSQSMSLSPSATSRAPRYSVTAAPLAKLILLFPVVNADVAGCASSLPERSIVEPFCIVQP